MPQSTSDPGNIPSVDSSHDRPVREEAASSCLLAVSCVLAGTTSIASNRPRASTTRNRLWPSTFLPMSNPRVAAGTVLGAFADLESMIPAVGATPRLPAHGAGLVTRVDTFRSHPSRASGRSRSRRGVSQGGWSDGNARHAYPVRTTYKIAFTRSRRLCFDSVVGRRHR